jgi:hypothetical protein
VFVSDCREEFAIVVVVVVVGGRGGERERNSRFSVLIVFGMAKSTIDSLRR